MSHFTVQGLKSMSVKIQDTISKEVHSGRHWTEEDPGWCLFRFRQVCKFSCLMVSVYVNIL